MNHGEVSRDQETKSRTDRRAHTFLEVDRKQSATPLTNTKEVVGLTVMVAHPPLEEVSSEETTELLRPDLFVEDAFPEGEEPLAPDLYEAPIAEVEHVERETESYVAWVIVLGFVAYAIALYWANRCDRKGGDPSIKFSVLKGFIVKCRK
jgi:hypothetical protein